MTAKDDDDLRKAVACALTEVFPHMTELDELLDSERLEELREMCGSRRLFDRFCGELWLILNTYSSNLADERNERAISGQSRKEARIALHHPLKSLAEATEKALAVLDEIKEHRTRPTGRALMEAAAVDRLDKENGFPSTLWESVAPRTNEDPPTARFGPGSVDQLGDRRTEVARYFLNSLDRWARSAAEKTKPRGRPREDASRTAIHELAKLWERETGDWPTHGGAEGAKKGPFLDFCRKALNPIRRLHNIDDAELTGLVDELPSRSKHQKK